ncbi:NAD(P)/FAD-dependent oxidoreductase [Bdellovibrio sp. HCB209]|uniref:NAD(P)/FAD-dependent oxidoreductase n=1 Tax=Bdellovibrio sp. HCB209 TaxID=3394354 RepID=UPI0039B4D23F
MIFDYEVLIVGGGPGGLSAAMTLGRINRTALVCDDNNPRNKPSLHANNFPGNDGIHPSEWRSKVRDELKKYPTIKLQNSTVVEIHKKTDGFEALLSSGKTVAIKKVILAYGVRDRLLPIPGFKELWGQSIFHCPFCHGFEISGSKLGLIVKNSFAFHPLPLIESLASDLILFTDGGDPFTAEQLQILERKNIPVINYKIESFDYSGTTLHAVILENGQRVQQDYLFYSAEFPFELKSNLGRSLGCAVTDFGLYQVNEVGATTVPGVYACGDNMQLMQSVLLSCASGVKAGSSVIFELLAFKH